MKRKKHPYRALEDTDNYIGGEFVQGTFSVSDSKLYLSITREIFKELRKVGLV